MIELSVCGGDAAFCQNTLSTCYNRAVTLTETGQKVISAASEGDAL